MPPVDHHAVDEVAILSRWLHRHHGHPAILALPRADEPDAWTALAAAVQALDPEPADWSPDEDDGGEGRDGEEPEADGDDTDGPLDDEDAGEGVDVRLAVTGA